MYNFWLGLLRFSGASLVFWCGMAWAGLDYTSSMEAVVSFILGFLSLMLGTFMLCVQDGRIR